jgi:hypothetical protein
MGSSPSVLDSVFLFGDGCRRAPFLILYFLELVYPTTTGLAFFFFPERNQRAKFWPWEGPIEMPTQVTHATTTWCSGEAPDIDNVQYDYNVK